MPNRFIFKVNKKSMLNAYNVVSELLSFFLPKANQKKYIHILPLTLSSPNIRLYYGRRGPCKKGRESIGITEHC